MQFASQTFRNVHHSEYKAKRTCEPPKSELKGLNSEVFLVLRPHTAYVYF